MAHFYLIISLFSCILFSQVNDLKVISYNIRYDNPDDGDNNWKHRKETLINYFNENKPDLIGMQEVLITQLSYLDKSLDEYKYVGVGREDGKSKGEYSPIFYRNSQLKLLETSTFWLSETPNEISIGWDAALERICTYALFEHLRTKKQFWVFNTHFDHLGIEARAQSASLILKTIKNININNFPVLITGDFNLTPNTIPIQTLQKDFQDVMNYLNPEDPRYGTFTGFDIGKNATQRIDYIFQKGFTVNFAKHLWVKTENDLWASDHHPVYMVCSF